LAAYSSASSDTCASSWPKGCDSGYSFLSADGGGGGTTEGGVVAAKPGGLEKGGVEVCDTDVVLVLVEVDDEREKLKLALVDTVRVDRSDRREAERCRASPSCDFLVCDGARCGMAGSSVEGGAVVPASAP